MKKHDFESTSKKNAKEQTPEMAEREQEILMWMGDIRAIKVCQDILL